MKNILTNWCLPAVVSDVTYRCNEWRGCWLLALVLGDKERAAGTDSTSRRFLCTSDA